ncbi:uncharacterized protein LOC114364308 [Ostrinia furnacalis]|uniref:uncharacterized protein LOC114364308 n=1 Tax=Ostrinia furnacalis TaxID=93504 RepID=UPI00103BA5F7|nr:uncharacterized protein LOC114364308 [Ostrinia furnacalis]
MRNAFVVLVSLCIGLASGFIVPSGVLELIDDNHAILADNNGKESEEAKRATLQEDTGFIVLPFRTHNEKKIDLETNRNRIKDNELYDQDTTKHNNVNERSFIYINQKFKTPVVNQLYTSQDLIRETYKSLIPNGDDYVQYPVKHTSAFNIPKPKNEYFEANIGRVETNNLYFPPASDYQETNKELTNENKHDFGMPKSRPLNKVTDEQREYVELLKPPLLRPVHTSEKENQQWPISVPSQQNYPSLNRNLQDPNQPLDISRQFAMAYYDNYGFPTPYGYQRSIPQFSKPDELGKGTDSILKKLINENNNIEINKLLDRYLKESLEVQVTNDRMNVKNNNCNYSNCVLKSTKQYLNGRINKGDAECKCGRRLNVLKQRESNGFADKEINTDKESTIKPEVNVMMNTLRPSDIGDYGDMLAEEMNLKKLIED